MDLKQILGSLTDKMQKQADVKFVFGSLIEAKGKSIIPVSAIKYSVGGGQGRGPDISKIKGVAKDETEGEEKENRPGGEGGGGRFSNRPLGIFEISDTNTRFIPVIPLKEIVFALCIWMITGKLLKKK
ncbi:MAG: hypothetical protein K9N07_08770 [Candidatus Cloacimonetes bacterium]|nr:hypothetical protein [Candidatus Cloacimonadota bacterium]MCF8396471.1 hypothetical protein [Melioribacteraceae bacterium]